ncbi:MAG: hypothetical protein E7146_02100 [Rikenellaceae bacterium]|nr:hypothetical protein [Rikenellaceae bacterium]
MKFRFLALLALVLGLASCQNDPEGINIDANGEAAVTLNVSLPEEATRAAGANSALGAIGNIDVENSFDIRYILEVYNPDGTPAKDRMTKIKDTETTAAFSFRLIPGRGYKFVVWADFVAEGANPEDATNDDLHYNTTAGLRAVTVVTNNWTVIDESRDAYTGVADVANFSGASSVPEIKLTRPFAKLRVVTNDILEMISVHPAEVKVNYFNTKFNDTFDAFTEKASGSVDAPANLTVKLIDATNPDTYTGETPETNGVQTLFADYFFGAEDDRVMFTLDVKDNGTTPQDLPQVTFNTNIPVKRNYLTTVYGPILTDANNITVTIDSAFENVDNNGNGTDPDYEVKVVDSAVDFLKALKDPNIGHIVLTQSFTITAEDIAAAGVSTFATRAGEAEGNTTVINLNGFTITFADGAVIEVSENTTLIIKDESEDKTGKVVIEDTNNDGNATGGINNKGIISAEEGIITTDVITNGENALDLITVAEGFAKDANDVYYILDKVGMFSFAEYVNGGNTLLNKTVKLNVDVDLANEPWTPIGNATEHTATFRGTFDGQNHKVSNLVVNGDTGVGLFGMVSPKAIKNLTIENAEVNGTHYGGVLAGWVQSVDSQAHNRGAIENCHVKNAKVTLSVVDKDNGDKAGALLGYAVRLDVKDCSVDGAIVTAYRDVAGLVGCAHEGCVVTNNSVKNVTVTADQTAEYGEEAEANAGEVVGRMINEPTVENNTTENVIVKINITDGVVKQGSTYYISNAAGLKWVANVVNNTTPYTPTLFDEATVELTDNIDLSNEEWIPIGDDRSQRTEWHGIFDGKGYTVKNIKITKKTDREDENKSSYGLFGNVKGTVKNLTVENVSISGAPKFIGALVGRLNNGLIENCHVKSSSVECENWTIGGLVGQFNNGKISGCSVEDTTIKGYSAVGAITGIALNQGERTIENCSVKNCALVKNGSFGGDYDKMFGVVVGGLYSGELTVNINGCTSENNTINGEVSSIMCGYVSEGDKLYIDGFEYIADGLLKKGAEYQVYNANGLATLNEMMADKSAGNNAVVNLIANIDFTGKTWTPVDSHADTKFTFKELNGNGYTISNLTINGQAMFKRFAGSGNVVVKDVTFDNATVNSEKINTSILTVQTYQNVLLDNVDVKNSTITGGYKVAPLIATVFNENSSTITATLKNCDVENVTVKATLYDFCTTGMVAFVYADDNDRVEFENCTVKDVKLIAPNDGNKAHAAIYTTGSGSLYNEAEGVTVTNVTFEAL